MCVCAYPPTNDCCNNRQQSWKVRGSLVNIVQTTGHNPPVTHSICTHSWTPSTWITSSNTAMLTGLLYHLYHSRRMCFVSPQRLFCTFMIKWWEVVKCDGWLDWEAYEVWSRGNIRGYLPVPMFSYKRFHFNKSKTCAWSFFFTLPLIRGFVPFHLGLMLRYTIQIFHTGLGESFLTVQ